MWKEWEMKNWQRSDSQKVEGKRSQGRPRMRWEDWVKRDLEKVGGEWTTTMVVLCEAWIGCYL